MASDEEDDYMNMTFLEPEAALPSTSLQRKQLSRKQAAERGRPKSKKEVEAEAAAKRDAALATNLDPSNKGAKMMAKLGYKGGALGKSENARTQPIEMQTKDDRGGIGADSEKKRKIREHMEAIQGKEKRQKADEGEFRERNRREREEKRNEGMMWAAMRITEKFDTEDREEDGRTNLPLTEEVQVGLTDTKTESSHPALTSAERPGKVNVLWRPLLRQRTDRERERKLRHAMSQGLASDNDPEEDEDDKVALGLGAEIEDLDEEDPELDEFMALEPAERLRRIVEYLRLTYNYCFWCKFRYPDADMEGCPGTTEEDHD